VYIVSGQGAVPSPARRLEWTADDVPRHDPAAPIVLERWEGVLRSGGIIQGPQHSFPETERAVLLAHGVCSIVVVPIFVGPTWWGAMGFDDCRAERDWPMGAVDVLKTAASTVGAAIERRRAEAARMQLVREQSARAEAEAAQKRLAFLAEASRVLASSLDYQTTLQSVADLAVPTLADSCVVDILDDDGWVRRVATAGNGLHGRVARWRMDEAPLPVAEVIRTAQPRLYRQLPPELSDSLAAADDCFVSAIVVPLMTRAETIGAITCLVASEREPFDTRDLSLAQDLARRCALAIESASLYGDAREAVSIRDEFLSVAAHELKTPMTSLRGYAQLLGREFEKGSPPNPERARRAALTIQVQADKLARLVGQLLDVSRIQAGKLAIERRQTDISQLVREVLDAARQQFHGHSIVARLPEELQMRMDPLRIEQVVTNLIDNAIKYSPEGGQIDVELGEDAARGLVIFAVRDRGVGVSPEHRAHIFDRFYQAHAGGALTSMAGMGLGLYISRQIVELHGGAIEAEFPDDGGTRFVVSLPR
jgi:signal transduction histidine kinase